MAPPRILATDAAIALIDRLAALHGPLMFHQSRGCCDVSAPMCSGELLLFVVPSPSSPYVLSPQHHKLPSVCSAHAW